MEKIPLTPAGLAAMQLHETYLVNEAVNIFRVPEGWIYEYYRSSEMITAVFVPEPMREHIANVDFDPLPIHIATAEDYAEGAREREEEAEQERLKAAKEKAHKDEKARLALKLQDEKLKNKANKQALGFIGMLAFTFLLSAGGYISYKNGYAAGKLENSKELSTIIDRQRAHIEKQEQVFAEYTRAYDEQAKMFIEHLASNHD